MRLFLFFSFFVSFHSMAEFSGGWVNESASQSFSIDLFKKGNEISGRYCFITNNGNRIDCNEGNEMNINGVIKNNVGLVSFESTFGGIGRATLSIKNEMLIFEVNDCSPFIEANMSVPDTIILKRKISTNQE